MFQILWNWIWQFKFGCFDHLTCGVSGVYRSTLSVEFVENLSLDTESMETLLLKVHHQEVGGGWARTRHTTSACRWRGSWMVWTLGPEHTGRCWTSSLRRLDTASPSVLEATQE